ncbi:hypothetical protein NBRC3293_2380 [Gluconobacter oxydans NBRC 3293]|uniref:Uncharacterized protein n=1 Tax=Gluconobacter oxydans NBRC 3293 TaxID=1315969 RepID=A0A829WXM7_GLUOY|nr:hypothetical protein NBRC3293_2380 [Gluconobacter oxydans NBRC 3293]
MIWKWFCRKMAFYWKWVARCRADKAAFALERAEAWNRRAGV